MLSPGAAVLDRPPRRTAAGNACVVLTPSSHGGLRPQPPRYDIYQWSGL